MTGRPLASAPAVAPTILELPDAAQPVEVLVAVELVAPGRRWCRHEALSGVVAVVITGPFVVCGTLPGVTHASPNAPSTDHKPDQTGPYPKKTGLYRNSLGGRELEEVEGPNRIS